jgi:hypothetical protein
MVLCVHDMGVLRLEIEEHNETFLVFLHCTYDVMLLTPSLLNITDVLWTTNFLNWAMQRQSSTCSTMRLSRFIQFLLNPQCQIKTPREYLGRIRAIGCALQTLSNNGELLDFDKLISVHVPSKKDSMVEYNRYKCSKRFTYTEDDGACIRPFNAMQNTTIHACCVTHKHPCKSSADKMLSSVWSLLPVLAGPGLALKTEDSSTSETNQCSSRKRKAQTESPLFLHDSIPVVCSAQDVSLKKCTSKEKVVESTNSNVDADVTLSFVSLSMQ